MKLSNQPCLRLVAITLFSGTVFVPTLRAGLAPEPAATTSPQSVFVMPASPKEGCDPFFPNSTRPYNTAGPVTQNVEWTSLKLAGVSGSPDHRLVIINNNTFAEGDEQDVSVPGGRIHVSCLKISPRSVLIKVAGQTHELIFTNNE